MSITRPAELSVTADGRTLESIPEAIDRRPPRRWRSRLDGLRFSLSVYLVSRVFVLIGVLAYLRRHPTATLRGVAMKWDGWWYVRLAEHGYSRSLRPPLPRPADWHHQYSDWAFFPGYPLAIRAVHVVTALSYAAAAVALSLLFGLLAVHAAYLLGRAYDGPQAGRGAALLLAAWPGSAVFGQPYSEGLFLACAAGSLVLLARRRWVAAGLLGAAASATRPTGTAVIAAAAAVALVELVRRRDPRPLISPVLASAGTAGFALYGWARTGDPLVWRHAENLWSQRFDLSHKLVTTWISILGHPGTAARTSGGRALLAATGLELAGIVVLAVLLAAAWARRRELGLAPAVYTLVTFALIVGYSAVGPRPRTVLALLPGFVWVAAWWPRRVTLVVAASLLPLLTVVTYLWLWNVTP